MTSVSAAQAALNPPVAVQGQFDGIFHDTTAVAGGERRGGVRQLHAGKSLRSHSDITGHHHAPRASHSIAALITQHASQVKADGNGEVTCVLEVSMVGMGFALDPEREI